MPETLVPLSLSALTDVLESLVHVGTSKKSEDAVAEAIVSGATLIQNAIIGGQSIDDISEIFSLCPEAAVDGLMQILDRTASVQQAEDGGSTSLWMLPVVLTTKQPLWSVMSLERSSTFCMLMESVFQAQLGLNSAPFGWIKVLPELVSLQQIQDTKLNQLVSLPYRLRNFGKTGKGPDLSFQDFESAQKLNVNSALFYLPFIARHPPGKPLALPSINDQMVHKLTKWVSNSIGHVLSVQVAPQPHPFGSALPVGEEMLLKADLRRMVLETKEELQVDPRGMAALVAPYVPDGANTVALGVSLVSILSGADLATFNSPLDRHSQADIAHIVDTAVQVLKEFGVSVQRTYDHIETFSCQRCGCLQFEGPEVAPRNPAKTLH